jgi:hypothetical protein
VISSAYSDNENAVVIDEKPGTTQEIDLTNIPLDNYLNTLQDEELRELLQKYFFLPSEFTDEPLKTEDIAAQRTDTSLVDKAKELSLLPREELRAIVAKIEADLPALKAKQYAKYLEDMANLEETINDSIMANKNSVQATNRYSYTLDKGYMSDAGQKVLWIKSVVQWDVNTSTGNVTYLAPTTTSEKTSYYAWYGDIYGNQYISNGKGYVDKSRDATVAGDDEP